MVRKLNPVKHEEKRAEILAAAERCIESAGFHGATIAQICAEANVSPGHLYHYFDSKEAIIDAITDLGLKYATSRFAEVTEKTNSIAILVEEFERLKTLQRKSGSGVLLDILAEAGRNPAIAKSLQESSRGMRVLFAEFVRSGQKRGEIDPQLDAETTAAFLIGIIDSNKTVAIREPKLSAKKSAKVLETMITRFLSPPRN
jgi:TetR/AcrR family transcriptional regulator, repressor for uid operon